MQHLAGTPEYPAYSPSALQLVVTEQGRKLYKNWAHKVPRHRKFKLSLGFGQKNLYEGILRGDKDKHLDWARRASLYGEYHFQYIMLLLKIKRNIVILFTYFFGKKKINLKILICVVPPLVTVFICWWLSAVSHDSDVTRTTCQQLCK